MTPSFYRIKISRSHKKSLYLRRVEKGNFGHLKWRQRVVGDGTHVWHAYST